MPLPVPLPLRTTIHDVPLVADHWQPAAVVTEIGLELTPEAETEMLCCDNVYMHPACATVTVFPATVNVPVRAMLVFAGTLNVTLPLPLAPDTIEIQVALLVAVHAQPLCVVTFVVELPPGAGSASVVGETVNVHGAL